MIICVLSSLYKDVTNKKAIIHSMNAGILLCFRLLNHKSALMIIFISLISKKIQNIDTVFRMLRVFGWKNAANNKKTLNIVGSTKVLHHQVGNLQRFVGEIFGPQKLFSEAVYVLTFCLRWVSIARHSLSHM